VSRADPESLRELARRAEAVLAVAPEAARAYSRAKAQGTPLYKRHRLLAIADLVRSSAEGDGVEAFSLVELHLTLELFDYWKPSPVWPAILRSLKDPDFYPHTLITLAAARALIDTGNAVTLSESSTAQGRDADLVLTFGDAPELAIEVKAPKRLHGPQAELTPADARRIVESTLKKAGTGRRGQLSPPRSGMRMVGGLHLRQADVGLLNSAADRLLARTGASRSHILAVAFCSLGLAVTNFEMRDGRLVPVAGSEAQLQPSITLEIAPNPGYRGLHHLAADAAGPMDWLSAPPPAAREFTIPLEC
jgi:hypothetical protein